MARRHLERHKSDRIGWLRAAVLGANDGTISVASLAVGIAASGAPVANVLLTSIAGMVAGAVSMAAGEYVSVQSQADTENADLAKEKLELETQPELELIELKSIYMQRGLDEPLARQVAEKLTSNNALEAHARDELGITEAFRAKPVQAALASAVSFSVGAMIPVATVLIAPAEHVASVTSAVTLAALFGLGGAAGWAGGASVVRGAFRVAFWGALAMGLTAMVGRIFGAAV